MLKVMMWVAFLSCNIAFRDERYTKSLVEIFPGLDRVGKHFLEKLDEREKGIREPSKTENRVHSIF